MFTQARFYVLLHFFLAAALFPQTELVKNTENNTFRILEVSTGAYQYICGSIEENVWVGITKTDAEYTFSQIDNAKVVKPINSAKYRLTETPTATASIKVTYDLFLSESDTPAASEPQPVTLKDMLLKLFNTDTPQTNASFGSTQIVSFLEILDAAAFENSSEHTTWYHILRVKPLGPSTTVKGFTPITGSPDLFTFSDGGYMVERYVEVIFFNGNIIERCTARSDKDWNRLEEYTSRVREGIVSDEKRTLEYLKTRFDATLKFATYNNELGRLEKAPLSIQYDEQKTMIIRHLVTIDMTPKSIPELP